MPTVHAALPTCSTFGSNLDQTTGTQAPGLYIKIGNEASCAGNATAWNVCYYSNKSDATMISYFAIYRPTTKQSYIYIYNRVGSATTYNATRNLSSPYVCDHIPIPQSQQYMVQPQDVLAVCLNSVGEGYQGMVASQTRWASVLMRTTNCTSTIMGSTLSVSVNGNWNSNPNGFSTITSTTLHISIGT